MRKNRVLAAGLAGLTSLAVAPPASAATGYTLYAVTSLNQLVSFPSDDPGAVTVIGTVGPLALGERVVALDARASNGKLYALTRRPQLLGAPVGKLYTVSTVSAAASAVKTLSTALLAPPLLGSRPYDIDFNPCADALRIVAGTQNIRVAGGGNGVETVDAPLAFQAGDPNFGDTPDAIGAAYTPASPAPGANCTTTLYDIDAANPALATQGSANYNAAAPAPGSLSPNTGKLFTTGAATANAAGLDIAPDGTAFAGSGSAGSVTLLRITLTTGVINLVGSLTLSLGTSLVSLAVGAPLGPGPVVPEAPLAVLLPLAGAATAGAVTLHRRHVGRNLLRDASGEGRY